MFRDDKKKLTKLKNFEPISKYPNSANFELFGLLFFFNVHQTFIYNMLDYFKIHICQLKVAFHGVHHILTL